MQRAILSLIALSAGLVASAQEPQKGDKPPEKLAIVPNTGGHTSPLAGLAFTPDGKRLITCEYSNVHVWKVPSGEWERTWRLPSAVHAIAVSPKGTTAAAMGNVEDQDTPVWLLDWNTGEQTAFAISGVRGHFGIRSLAFSPNGRRLAWCCWFQAGTINLERHRVTHTVVLKDEATQVAFDNTGQRLLVNGGNPLKQNRLVVHEVKPGPDAKALKLFELAESESKDPGLVAWSSDDQLFAGWFPDRGSKLFLWDAAGKKAAKKAVDLPGESSVHHVQFVGPDKVVAVSTTAKKLLVHRVDAAKREVDRTREYGWSNPQNAAVIAAVSHDGKYLAVTSSPGYRVRLFDLDDDKRLGDVGRSFATAVDVAWGADNRSIAWSTGPEKPKRGINLSTLKPLDAEALKKLAPDLGGAGYRFEFDEAKRSLYVERGKSRVATKFDMPVLHRVAFKDANDKLKFILLGQWNQGRLSVLDPETGAIDDIDKYSGATAIAVSPDGKFLLLAQEDQTLLIYRLDDRAKKKAWRPLLHVLVVGDDWVVWTNAGYYAATFNGGQMIGFANRTAWDKALSFYPVERFREKLEQPDLIKQVLSRGTVAAAARATNTPAVVIERALPPKAVLVKEGQTGNSVTVRATATSINGEPVQAMRLQLDGSSFPSGQGYAEFKPGAKPEATWTVDIPEGMHHLSVLVRGSESMDRSNSIEVVGKQLEKDKPRILCLSVGLNYRWKKEFEEEPGFLDAAENDAGVILNTLRRECVGPNNRYGELIAEPALLGKEASKPAILKALADLRAKKPRPGDLVVLFYAGHGVAEGRKFYLLTAEVDPKNIEGTCLSGAELREALKQMPCNVLLVLDACQSGRALDQFATVTDEVGRTLVDDESGITVLAAAKPFENAQEKGGIGRLTDALQKTLADPLGAFYDSEAKIMNIRHLHTRVEDLVRNASKGKQNPVLLAPYSVPPLVLRRVP